MTHHARLARLFRMGPAELGFRSRSGAARLADRAWLALARPRPHEAGLAGRLARPDRRRAWWTDALVEARRRAAAGDVRGAGEALRAHLAGRAAPPLPGRPGDRDGRLAAMVAADPGLEARVVARAQAACAGRYDLLGHRGLDFGRGPEGGPDWHRDPVSGRRAPLVPWGQVPYLDPARVGDHKVVWELSRHQHWLDLALAHALTRRARYAERLASEAASWLAANPPKVGIHWTSMLECALRCLAWLRALPLVLDAPPLTGALVARLLGSFDRQLRHVRAHLSLYFSPNTHLLGEALGLLVGGLRLPELAAAPAWRAVGLAQLAAGATRQVLDDGLHAERSTAYHRYTTDFYLEAAAALEDAGPAFAGFADAPLDAAPIERALARLLDALAALTLPAGRLPALGDDDGGEALPLDGDGPFDARPTLGAGAVWLAPREPAAAAVLRAAAGEARPPARAAFLFGPRAADLAAAPPGPPTSCLPPANRLLADGGYAVLRRGTGVTADVVIVDVGPLGDEGRAGGSAGHAHADALSLFVVRHGVPRVLDPGSYTYTAEPVWRDAMRATTAHATVALGGRSSSEPAGPFCWATQAQVTRHACHLDGPVALVDASHDGYRRLEPPLDHRRIVVQGAGPGWWVLDVVVPSRAGSRRPPASVLVEVTWPLGLLPGEGPPTAIEGGFRWGSGPSAVGLLMAVVGGTGRLEGRCLLGGPPGPGWVSPRYGALESGAALRYAGSVSPPAAVWWWLGPAPLAARARLTALAVEPPDKPSDARSGTEQGPVGAPRAASWPGGRACRLTCDGGAAVVAWLPEPGRGGMVAGLPVEGRLTAVYLAPDGTLVARHVIA